MKSNPTEILTTELQAIRVMAILRSEMAEHLASAADCLVKCGLTVVEFSLTGEGTLRVLEEYASSAPPEAYLGAGTVTTPELAVAAVSAGARYLVTPGYVPEVMTEASALGVPVVAGALTPSEVLACWAAGAVAVKLFPASLGGIAYMQALRAPLPDIPLVPTGGVAVSEIRRYLDAGAMAIGLGSPLVGDACRTGDLENLRRRAIDVISECRAS